MRFADDSVKSTLFKGPLMRLKGSIHYIFTRKLLMFYKYTDINLGVTSSICIEQRKVLKYLADMIIPHCEYVYVKMETFMNNS